MIYTASGLDAAETAFDEFAEQWEDVYPAMVKSWRDTWDDFIPFLEFPAEQAAMKVLYLTSIERRKSRSNPTGRIAAWKSILNTHTIHYGDRLAVNNH